MARGRSFHHTVPQSLDAVQPTSVSPFSFFAPNNAKLVHRHHHDKQIHWNARAHRKQRYRAASPRYGRMRHTASVWGRIARMRKLEYWNISWWVAMFFTVGSVVWVVNGFQVFLPFVTSDAATPVASGWTGFVGATIFSFGSVLLMIEAWNRDDAACFGHAIEETLHPNHPHNKPGDESALIRNDKANVTDSDSANANENANGNGTANGSATEGTYCPAIQRNTTWIWFSTSSKFWHEIGFIASFCQFCGATIFWISGFSGLNQILTVLERHTAALDGAFWVPQVVGGSGFIISSALYMLETQTKWYKPAWKSLGWHIGTWNFIGAIGFTLSGAFGFSTASGPRYESALSTFWGSWAFLVASVLQWYEAVNPGHDSTKTQ
ncbi:hypothetical protein K439DRAFT_1628306 [Ramaria rubella]|nr:hypothetical protein K439DRAFT_1628306 [Ramaria rubella]